MTWYTCTVNEAGPADDATETPGGSVYINLTDQGGTFSHTWFYCAADSKSYMLAVALAAISLGAQVEVGAFPPGPGGTVAAPPAAVVSGTGVQAITEIQRLYLIAP
jgi:hypothetical protein